MPVPKRTIVMAVAPVDVVRDGARPAADRAREVVGIPGFKDVVCDNVSRERLEFRDCRPVELTQSGGLSIRASKTPVGHVAALREVRDILLGREIERRRAARALLRENLNHAGRCFRAVQCRGGWTLQDFEALDRFGIDVVQARRIAAPARTDEIAEAAAAVHAYAVDVDDRLIRLRQAGGAADADACAFARQPARREDADAGLARREHLGHVGDRRGLKLAGVDGRDRVAEFATLCGDTGAGDNDGVQPDRHRRHREVGRDGRVGRDADGLVAAAVTDAANPHDHLPERHVELILARGIRERAEVRSDDRDLRAVQRALGRRVDDFAFHGAGGLRRGEGCASARERQAGAQSAKHTRPTKRRSHLHLLFGGNQH